MTIYTPDIANLIDTFVAVDIIRRIDDALKRTFATIMMAICGPLRFSECLASIGKRVIKNVLIVLITVVIDINFVKN